VRHSWPRYGVSNKLVPNVLGGSSAIREVGFGFAPIQIIGEQGQHLARGLQLRRRNVGERTRDGGLDGSNRHVAHSSSLRGELNPQTPAVASIGLQLEESALAHLLKDTGERAGIE